GRAHRPTGPPALGLNRIFKYSDTYCYRRNFHLTILPLCSLTTVSNSGAIRTPRSSIDRSLILKRRHLSQDRLRVEKGFLNTPDVNIAIVTGTCQHPTVRTPH